MTADPSWDAVVVGAGAGGAAAAWGLCRRGMSVLLLDAGPGFDPLADYPLTGANWSRQGFPDKPGSKGEVTLSPGQELARDEPLLASFNKGWGRAAGDGRRSMDGYDHVRGIGGTARPPDQAHWRSCRRMCRPSGTTK